MLVKKSVEVEVIKAERRGLTVKILETNQIGFIRRRDLSWDQRLDSVPVLPNVGDRIKAVITRNRRGDRYAYLSLRNLVDPWDGLDCEAWQGTPMRGEVINVRHFGAFIQLRPGINALAWAKSIPLLRDETPVDVLSVGDQVMGVVTFVDAKRRQIEYSISEYLHRLGARKLSERRIEQETLFRPRTLADDSANSAVPSATAPTRKYYRRIPQPKHILVVDNDGPDLQAICQHLEKELQVTVQGVFSGGEAVQALDNSGVTVDLAVIDVNLNGESGLNVAAALSHINPNIAILMVSNDPFVNTSQMEVRGRILPFEVKYPEAIISTIIAWANGALEVLNAPDSAAYVGRGSFVSQLGMTELVGHSLEERLTDLLVQLKRKAGVSQALVFEVDSTKEAVSILAEAPSLTNLIRQEITEGLYYSPVQNVVEDEEDYYETNYAESYHPRFRRLFPILPFQSCFGVPLKIPDLKTRHALFLFDSERPALELEDIDFARQMATLAQIALERSLLLDFMRRYAHRYSQGLLASSLMHEMQGKLDTAGAFVESLAAVVEGHDGFSGGGGAAETWGTIRQVASGLQESVTDLTQLVHAYSLLARDKIGDVDVDDVIRRTVLQFDQLAKEQGVEIIVNSEPGLPRAQAIPSRLQQILTNLILNAIQQIERQRDYIERVAKQQPRFDSISQHRLVIIQARHIRTNSARPIRVDVIDSGPGVHYQKREYLFLLDMTTREEGHGLGLFIGRNLAETMGGRLVMSDSLIFVGSAFTLELSVHT